MLVYTIETTYRLPVYRQCCYEAPTLADACRLAVDDDWDDSKRDYDLAGETYVTGAWEGTDTAYGGPALQVPSHYHETLQRKAGRHAGRGGPRLLGRPRGARGRQG